MTKEKRVVSDPIVQRIMILLSEKGKSEVDLTSFLGLPPGSMTKWKYYGSKIYLQYIPRICEFLDTNPNYLFLGDDESSTDVEKELTQTETNLIRLFRSVDIKKQKCIIDTLSFFAE